MNERETLYLMPDRTARLSADGPPLKILHEYEWGQDGGDPTLIGVRLGLDERYLSPELSLKPFIGSIVTGFSIEDMRRLEARDAALRQGRQQRSCAHGRTCRMPPEQRCAGPECALVMVE